MSTVGHTFDNALGCMDEVFSGNNYIWLEESVPHQGFSSSGVIFPLVQGLLGLEGNALQKTISFEPHFPADWKKVLIKNYRVGKSNFSFDYIRNKSSLKVYIQAEKAEGYKLRLAPALGIGSLIKSLLVDGEATSFKTKSSAQVIQVEADISLRKKSMIVEMEYIPAVEVLPPMVDWPLQQQRR